MAQLEDLDDDCLLEILDRLPPDQLLILLEVNRRLERLASDKLRTKIKIIVPCERRKMYFVHECSHFRSLNSEHVLVLEDLELEEEPSPNPSWWIKILQPVLNYFYQPRQADILLSATEKCSGVKSIEFGEFCLSDKTILEVVRLCSELECIKLADSKLDKNDWSTILDAVGHQIVHFVKRSLDSLNITMSVSKENARLLAIVAEKCVNIQRVDWLITWQFNSDLLASIKQLPNSCYRWIFCGLLLNDTSDRRNRFEDVFDKLYVKELDWNALPQRVDRLSSLEFHSLSSVFVHRPGVEFVNLKKLNVKQIASSFDCLLASQFPCLEQFRFNASNIVNEHKAVFKHISTINKLIIGIDFNDNPMYNPRLPSFSSICHLNNLDTIGLIIWYVPDDWQPEHGFLRQLVQYVNEIATLKKLFVISENYDNRGVMKLLSAANQLKLKQNRVEVDLPFNLESCE